MLGNLSPNDHTGAASVPDRVYLMRGAAARWRYEQHGNIVILAAELGFMVVLYHASSRVLDLYGAALPR